MLFNFCLRLIKSSRIKDLVAFQGLGAYCISKTALFGLTRALSIECADLGIRVNCVAPGIIKTRFSAAVSV